MHQLGIDKTQWKKGLMPGTTEQHSIIKLQDHLSIEDLETLAYQILVELVPNFSMVYLTTDNSARPNSENVLFKTRTNPDQC